MTKSQIFDQNLWLTPLKNVNCKVFLNRCFYSPKGLVFSIKRNNRFFHDFFHDLLNEDTEGYNWLQRLQEVTMGYRGLQGLTAGYREFFLTRTFPETFSWSILHNNKSWRNLKFLRKTVDSPFWKKANFAFVIDKCPNILVGFLFCLKR